MSQAEQVERLGVLDGRHHQALAIVDRDGHAEVDVALDDGVVLADLRVHPRPRSHRVDGRAHDEGQEREADAIVVLELRLEAIANVRDATEVDLPDLRDMRGSLDRLAHVLRRHLAHTREGVDLLAIAGGGRSDGCGGCGRRWCGSGRCGDRRSRNRCGRCGRSNCRWLGHRRGVPTTAGARGKEVLNVLLRNASTPTGASDLSDVKLMLGDHAGDNRRHEGAIFATRRQLRDRLWCSSDSRNGGSSDGSSRHRSSRDGRSNLCRRCSNRGSGRCGGEIGRKHGDARANVDRHALGDQQLDHHASTGRWHLGIDLVCRDLNDRLVGLNGVADLLEPAANRSFGHTRPHLGHYHVHIARDCHRRTSLRVIASIRSNPSADG